MFIRTMFSLRIDKVLPVKSLIIALYFQTQQPDYRWLTVHYVPGNSTLHEFSASTHATVLDLTDVTISMVLLVQLRFHSCYRDHFENDVFKICFSVAFCPIFQSYITHLIQDMQDKKLNGLQAINTIKNLV